MLHVRSAAEKIEKGEDGREENRNKADGEEELGGDHEARDEVAADLVVAGGERVIDPPAAHEEAALGGVLWIWKGAEAVRPEAQAVEAGTCDTVVRDEPAGRTEGDCDHYEGEHEEAEPDVAG